MPWRSAPPARSSGRRSLGLEGEPRAGLSDRREAGRPSVGGRARRGGWGEDAAAQLLEGGEGVVEGADGDDAHGPGVALGVALLLRGDEERDRSRLAGGGGLLGHPADGADPSVGVDGGGDGHLLPPGGAGGGGGVGG